MDFPYDFFRVHLMAHVAEGEKFKICPGRGKAFGESSIFKEDFVKWYRVRK